MPEQLRYDNGKPKMSYILAQTPEAACILAGVSIWGPLGSLLEDLCLYMRDEMQADDVLINLKEYAAKIGLDLLTEVAEVYTYGGNKYARGNYLLGQTVSHYLDSAARHLFALIRGEERDAESGKHHLAHIWWNIERSADQTHERDDRLFKGNPNLKPAEPKPVPVPVPASAAVKVLDFPGPFDW